MRARGIVLAPRLPSSLLFVRSPLPSMASHRKKSRLAAPAAASIVYPTLRQNALRVRMLHFLHLGDQIRQFQQLRMRVPPRTDHVNALGPVPQGLHHRLRVEHLVANRVIDFVENNQIISAAVNRGSPSLPAFLRQLDVLWIRFRSANLHESAAHGPDFKLVVAE